MLSALTRAVGSERRLLRLVDEVAGPSGEARRTWEESGEEDFSLMRRCHWGLAEPRVLSLEADCCREAGGAGDGVGDASPGRTKDLSSRGFANSARQSSLFMEIRSSLELEGCGFDFQLPLLEVDSDVVQSSS